MLVMSGDVAVSVGGLVGSYRQGEGDKRRRLRNVTPGLVAKLRATEGDSRRQLAPWANAREMSDHADCVFALPTLDSGTCGLGDTASGT
jgi:hypothetical protein